MPIELKTAIIVDPVGSSLGDRTPEDEIKQHIKDFSELLSPAKLKVYSPWSCYPEDLQPGTDLVLFDYGGMMLGNSMAEKNSWHLVAYAADNPSALLSVRSLDQRDGLRTGSAENARGAQHRATLLGAQTSLWRCLGWRKGTR